MRADLSRYYHADSQPSFEEIFAQESSLSPCTSGHPELVGAPPHPDGDTTMSLSTPPSPLTLSPAELEQNRLVASDSDRVPDQDLLEVEQRINHVKPTPSPLALRPQRRNRSSNNRGLQVSDKKNLVPTDIPTVADLLINPEAISYFLYNCRSIYEKWVPHSAQQPQGSDHDIETSVIAAMDTVRDLRKGDRLCRFLLRFAYIRLIWIIDVYKAVAVIHRVEGKTSRNVGHGDATTAIDLYLEKRRQVSSEQVKRGQLVADCQTGRRWVSLAGRSPLLVFIFPQTADTIVYVPLQPPIGSRLTVSTGRITLS
jgi:hypothetical protein